MSAPVSGGVQRCAQQARQSPVACVTSAPVSGSLSVGVSGCPVVSVGVCACPAAHAIMELAKQLLHCT